MHLPSLILNFDVDPSVLPAWRLSARHELPLTLQWELFPIDWLRPCPFSVTPA